MAHPNDNESSSDADLVQAIKSSRKRSKTTSAQQSVQQQHNNSSQLQQHQRGRSLPDINFEDNQREPQNTSIGERKDASQDDEKSKKSGPSTSWSHSSQYKPHLPNRQQRGNKKHARFGLEEELRRAKASNEALLFVLEDRLSCLSPVQRNTSIHMYAEHFEVAMSNLDQEAKRSSKMSTTNDQSSSQSSTALLHSKLSVSRPDLEEQLRHIRKLLWPRLGDKSVLDYMSSTERVVTRSYILKHETSLEPVSNLAQLGKTPQEPSTRDKAQHPILSPKKTFEFKERRDAMAHVEQIVKEQQRLNRECGCQSVQTKTSTEEKYKKKRKRQGPTCYSRKYKRTCDEMPLEFACYELFHCSNYYTYWYIDVKVEWVMGQEHQRNDRKNTEDGAKGTKANKHKTTNVWVVSGNLLKMTGGYTADLAKPASVMEMTRLPTSVWKERHLANMHAAELFTCSSKVNEAIRNHNDEIVWLKWMKPAIHQAWSKLVGHKDELFECTVDIPDLMRERLGYHAVSVQVEYIGS